MRLIHFGGGGGVSIVACVPFATSSLPFPEADIGTPTPPHPTNILYTNVYFNSRTPPWHFSKYEHDDGAWSFFFFFFLNQSIQGTLDTERKFAAGENKSSHRGHMNMKKLDDETEEFQREWESTAWPSTRPWERFV